MPLYQSTSIDCRVEPAVALVIAWVYLASRFSNQLVHQGVGASESLRENASTDVYAGSLARGACELIQSRLCHIC